VLSWAKCDLSRWFDDVVFSYRVKQRKPNPEIYMTACQNLHVTPDESIFIGDGGSNELIGARNVGMAAYHATWFLPEWKSEEIVGFPKLKKPKDVLKLV
jgi:putative hydrolase of the HAD superfamily